MTRGISEALPIEIQIKLWQLVDNIVAMDISTDYLQIFDLKVTDQYLEITHRQEEPPYSNTIQLPLETHYKELDGKKVYCIDDNDHSTMLFSSEY
jgi:hypothetical protein